MMDGVEALSISVHFVQRLAAGVAHGLYSIKQLRQLIIDAPPFSDPAMSSLPWLLAQASKLEVLVTSAGTRLWFPPLATLKHLSLEFHKDAGNFCEAVPTCTGLETLSLLSQRSPGSNELKVGDLELSCLPRLRVCVLKALAPRKITVPRACWLHIGVSAGTIMQGSVWQGVLANIHSISVGFHHRDLELFLNGTVNPLQNLRILNIHGFSAHPAFDLKCFARVRKLRISGRDVAVRLPAGVCWDALELDATDKLVLEFEDLSGFPVAVPNFLATYGNLRGTKVLELCTALALNGIKCAFEEEKQGKSMFWYPARQRCSGCCCGACLDCLVASGQAVANAGEAELPRFPGPPYGHGDFFGGHMANEEEDMYDDEDDDDEDEDDDDDDDEEDHGW